MIIYSPPGKMFLAKAEFIDGRLNIMKKSNKTIFISVALLAAFILWTVLVCVFDVRLIGTENSKVGFATLNSLFHSFTGVNMSLYTITDYLGLVPLAFAAGFALLGLMQWIKRKSIFNVDFSILVLGGFYILTIACFIFFEFFVINYRPVLINGNQEASYPSSTTLLVMCVMPTAIMQLSTRIKNKILKKCAFLLISAFLLFMVIARLFSGVHWLSDIVGGALLSSGLVMLYHWVCKLKC